MYAFDSRIRYSETDSEGRLTLNALLNYFQDCSTFHSEDVGLGIGYMKEIGQVWVLSAWQIVVNRYPQLGEKVRIVTLPYELKAFLGYRNFAMLDEKGEYIAKANSLWSLLDVATGKPVIVERMQGHPLFLSLLFIRHIFASYNLYCKNIQKTYSSKYFQKMYSVKSVFFINHLIRKLLPALILLPFIPFRLRNWLMDTWYLAAIPPNVSPCLIL